MIKRFIVRKYYSLQEKHFRVSAEVEKRAQEQCRVNAHQFEILAYKMRMKLEDLS